MVLFAAICWLKHRKLTSFTRSSESSPLDQVEAHNAHISEWRYSCESHRNAPQDEKRRLSVPGRVVIMHSRSSDSVVGDKMNVDDRYSRQEGGREMLRSTVVMSRSVADQLNARRDASVRSSLDGRGVAGSETGHNNDVVTLRRQLELMQQQTEALQSRFSYANEESVAGEPPLYSHVVMESNVD